MKGIFLFFFSIFTYHAFAQVYNFRNFNSEEGLAQSYVYSIIQDSKGYLWAGTGNGLSKFNGFIFENYTANDSLAENFISCGISDEECLWFGHMNGNISFFNGKTFRAINLSLLKLSHITHFSKSQDGTIWASSYSEGILKLSKEKGVVKRYFFNDKIFIISFDFLENNDLLIGTDAGLLYCRLKETGEIEIIRPIIEIPESKITGIIKMRSKSGFYIATENNGIFQLIYEDKLIKTSKMFADQGFEFNNIQDIIEDNQSNLWLASFGNGLIKIIYSSSGKFTRIQYFNKDKGFVTDNVKTIFEDGEGNIWSGNFGGGLSQLTPKTFSILTIDKSLYGNDIYSIFINGQYRWIGTEHGLVKMDDLTGKIIKFYSTVAGLPDDKVTTIYSSNGNELWIGTEKNGVFTMDTRTGKINNYPLGNEGVLENSITIIAGNGEHIWIGTKKGLCNVNSITKKINWYTISKGGLPHNYINCLYVDRKKRLWVSTRSNSLVYIQDEKIFKIPLNSIIGVISLGPITEDSDSLIWVGSNGSGIFTIASDSIINLTVKEGLLSNYCYSIICDYHNNIWVGHKGGLSRIRKADFSIKAIPHIEGIPDIGQFNPNAIIKDQSNKISFGSSHGLVYYDPSMEYSKLHPPILGITSIRVNDVEKKYSDKIILAPGQYKVKIDFLGINLKEPTLVSYQYMLEGYEQWSDITKNTSITYNQLTEGDYTFKLKASSGDGSVSKYPLTIHIIIKETIWKKWWFYLLAVTLLIIVTFMYIKRREYILQAEKKILEEKVRERTNEIELQKDLIEEKNANITSSINYASHIQKAVFPPIELLNKLLPDNFILYKPKDIVSGDFYWVAERNNKIVFTVADCTGHGVPGAFMSLLGINLLNEIVNIRGITRSDAIVEKLRERLIYSLQQSRSDIGSSNGMDIALCVLDLQEKKMQFTGGMNSLVCIRDGKQAIIKADRFSVCKLDEFSGHFTMKEIDCEEGDVYYLFSDGYQDQFGGNNDKKYLIQKFYKTLFEISEFPMYVQKEILEQKLIRWMEDKEQTDDITVMGIRL
jgi:ligand-binding sensor domain-containing protein/serine phosphatase RsbU (regulator of sigma subunit)